MASTTTEPQATSAANLAGELRLTETAVVDLLMRVNLGTGPAIRELINEGLLSILLAKQAAEEAAQS